MWVWLGREREFRGGGGAGCDVRWEWPLQRCYYGHTHTQRERPTFSPTRGLSARPRHTGSRLSLSLVLSALPLFALRDMAQPRSADSPRPPPVRPLVERARDARIFCGGVGGFVGACASTYKFGSVVYGIIFAGGSSAVLGASFVGIRHVIVAGDFRQDGEAVSGLAMGTLAALTRTAAAGGRAGMCTGIERGLACAAFARR